jgi:ParB family chromosome partitioning protein
MMQSLDEIAENALRVMDGETAVMLKPELLDNSFISDRIGENDEEYRQLREAIRLSGQSSPILVRPHPQFEGRYMIVFGHRRARVARDLGIEVRAIVKPLADIEHAIAQGQENTARADLTFIEKALFARRLLAGGMTKDTAKSALSIDDTLLSRMLSVAETVPEDVLDALGSAKGVGRDRWEDLKKLIAVPANASEASMFVGTDAFRTSADPFNALVGHLKRPKRTKAPATAKTWAPADRSVSVVARSRPKGFVLDFAEGQARPFGEWISSNLNSLYEAFRKSKQEN